MDKEINISRVENTLDRPIDIGDSTMTLRDIALTYMPLYDRTSEQMVADSVVARLKKTPNETYGDMFNRRVCTYLDEEIAARTNGTNASTEDVEQAMREQLATQGSNTSLLKWSETRVRNAIREDLTADDFASYRRSLREQKLMRLSADARSFAKDYLSEHTILSSDSDQTTFEALWILTNVTQPYPLRENATRRALLMQLADAVFQDEDFVVTSLLCMSYIHESNSAPGTVRVNTGPIALADGRDNDDIEALENFARTATIYRSILGDKLKAYAILSDIDLVDVFRVTNTETLHDAAVYYEQYRRVCERMGLIPLSFMQLLDESPEATSAYAVAKNDIQTNIEAATNAYWLKDPSFYYNANTIERMTQSISDYYNGLPGTSMSRDVAYQNTVDKLVVYGSQPEVLRVLLARPFMFISSEVPVRDEMYKPRDKGLGNELMPIIYPLTFNTEEDTI